MRGFGGESFGGGWGGEGRGQWEPESGADHTRSFKEALQHMLTEATDWQSRELLELLLFKIEDKERAVRMATDFATADPTDVKTFRQYKKLGILLACYTPAQQDYSYGDVKIKRGDKLMQIHLPPRQSDDKFGTGSITADIAESLQLTSDYIAQHGLTPTMITGVSYDPIVRIMERRFGLQAVRINIPDDWSNRVREVFHRFVDPNEEPSIGLMYSGLDDFQGRFPPRIQ